MEIVVQIIFFGIIIMVTSWLGRPVWFLVQGIQLIGLAALYLVSPSFTFDTVLGMSKSSHHLRSLIPPHYVSSVVYTVYSLIRGIAERVIYSKITMQMMGELDHLHGLVIRSMAIWYISQAFFVLYYRNSTDNGFLYAILQSQIVAYFLETVAHFPYVGKGHLSPTILHFPDNGAVFPAYMTLGNLVQFVMMSRPHEARPHQIICPNARIDGIGMLILGTSLFAFPKEIMSFTMNRTDFYCDSIVPAAALSCYIIYCGLLSLQSDTFEKAEYKRLVYWTRIAECLSFTTLVASYWIFSDLFNSNVVWVLLVFGMLLCNAGLAIRSTPDEKMKT